MANWPLSLALVEKDCSLALAATTFAPPSGLPPARTVPVMAAPGFIRTFFWTFLPDLTRTRTSVGAYLSTL